MSARDLPAPAPARSADRARRHVDGRGGKSSAGRQKSTLWSNFLDSMPRWPRAVIIEGDPGIGKTTLGWMLLNALAYRGCRMLTSRAAPAESVSAYSRTGRPVECGR